MHHVLAIGLMVLSSLGMVSVPNAIMYQHPELVFRAFIRPELRQYF